MSNASELRYCPRCGGPITAEAPQGLCPKCLLLQVSFATEAAPRAPSRGTPPTREDVAAAFPHLEILELIGQGGMGFVFKARQAKLDRFVALKILPQSLAGDPAFAERFTREGRLLARLNHPNIVTVHDFGQANGFFYLLMEFVDGVNLRQAMKAGRFTPAQALAIVPKICEALQFAHGEGILHRDIKPENILLDTRGRVKIADFGIAKLVAADREPGLSHAMGDNVAPAPGQDTSKPLNLTETGRVLGTPNYMAPEQLEHPQEVDHRADIYSLGVVFYEMLTGELPRGKFVPPSEKSTVDPRVDEVVFRALQKAPERRPQSAEEVRTQVETITRGGAPLDPDTVWIQPLPPDGSKARRRMLVVGAGLGLALVLALFLAWLVPYLRKQVASAVPKVVGSPVSASEPFIKSVVLTRATNQLLGSSEDTRNVGVWTDTPLQPGEVVFPALRHDDGPVEQTGCHSLCFIHWQKGNTRTSTSLGWYFGGSLGKDFGEAEAEAALAQLREHMAEGPLTLTNGRPVVLFSVTNDSGQVMTGYVEYTRAVPKPAGALGWLTAKPQAIVQVHHFSAYGPSLDYSVELPPGYALRATANMGQVSSFFAPPGTSANYGPVEPAPVYRLPATAKRGRVSAPFALAGTSNNYHSSWSQPIEFRHLSSPDAARDYPAQQQAQRLALEARSLAVQAMGPIPVVLGKPFTVFSLTNKAGEVYSGFFELVGPSSADSATDDAAAGPARNPLSANAPVPLPRRSERGPRRVSPAAAAVPGAPSAPRALRRPSGWTPPANSAAVLPGGTIDPATGMPLVPGGAIGMTIDPATGLPVPAPMRTPAPRTNIAPKPLPN